MIMTILPAYTERENPNQSLLFGFCIARPTAHTISLNTLQAHCSAHRTMRTHHDQDSTAKACQNDTPTLAMSTVVAELDNLGRSSLAMFMNRASKG